MWMDPTTAPRHYPTAPRTAATPVRALSVEEQLGIDPTSKLAAAIERLAAAIETWGGTREGVRE